MCRPIAFLALVLYFAGRDRRMVAHTEYRTTDRKRRFGFGLLLVIVGCLLPFGLWWCLRCGEATTLLIVRHADRPENQDVLSPEGVARAQALVQVGERAGIVAIYHSDTIRARATAAPLATALGITPEVYDAKDSASLINDIFAAHRGERVLVVGHRNTVPQIIAAAGGPTLPDINANEFDNLFVLTACRCRWGLARLVNLQYGAQSP